MSMATDGVPTSDEHRAAYLCDLWRKVRATEAHLARESDLCARQFILDELDRLCALVVTAVYH